MPDDFPLNDKGFNPFGDLIGLSFSRTQKGTSRCTLEVDKKLLNPHNLVHGGVIYAMADTGMGVALYGDLDENESCATIEIKIMYFKSVTSGAITCESTVLHRSKRIAIIESEISNEGRLIAKATGTFYVLRRGAPE
ncbi:MAG: PaaI family thioesterase [bacterium]